MAAFGKLAGVAGYGSVGLAEEGAVLRKMKISVVFSRLLITEIACVRVRTALSAIAK